MTPANRIHGCIVSELRPPSVSASTGLRLCSWRATPTCSAPRGAIGFRTCCRRSTPRAANVDEKISRKLGYDVSGCSVTDQVPEGKQYKCDVDYSVDTAYVLIDHDGYVYPL